MTTLRVKQYFLLVIAICVAIYHRTQIVAILLLTTLRQATSDVLSIRSALESMTSPSEHGGGDSDKVSIKSSKEPHEPKVEGNQQSKVERACVIFEVKKMASAKGFENWSSNKN